MGGKSTKAAIPPSIPHEPLPPAVFNIVVSKRGIVTNIG
jgi:hypothetical protein